MSSQANITTTPSPRPAARLPAALVTAVGLAVGAILTAHSRAAHFSFTFSAYDVGLHLQALWKLSLLRGLFNTLRGLDYWGDHLWLGYALLAPLYRVWTSPTLVYAYQDFGLAAGGLFVYGLARLRLRSRLLALVPPVLYWCYPGVIYTAQENFHPEAIGSTWLLAALWADAAGRRRFYWVAVVLALTTKEDLALYLLGFAAHDLLRGERQRALVLAAVSLGYFALAMRVLLPLFNGVGFFRASGGYWFSNWAANATSPAFYARVFTQPVARAYAWDLLWPVAFLPLLAPVTLLLLAAPAFVVNNLAGAYLVSVHYHYLYGIIPGIFAAAVSGLARLERHATLSLRAARLRRTVLVAGAALVLFPTLRFQVAHREWADSYVGMARRLRPYESDKTRLMYALFARIAPDARVSASHNLVPFLADRDWIFMFPNPWRVMYWGVKGENPAPPEIIDTLLLDEGAVDAGLRALAREIVASGWRVLVDERQLLYAVREGPRGERATAP